MASKRVFTVTAPEVRAWGRKQNESGADLPGTDATTHGRLNPTLVKAFNASHRGANAYKEPKQGGNPRPVQVHAFKPAKGRKRDVTYNVADARAKAVQAGLPVATKGRIPTSTLDALASKGRIG